MELNLLKDKNGYISYSDSISNIGLLTNELKLRPNFSWSPGARNNSWLKFNLLSISFIKSISFSITGTYDTIVVKTSLDNIGWELYEKYPFEYNGDDKIEFHNLSLTRQSKFILIEVVGTDGSFALSNFEILGEEILPDNQDYLSTISNNYYPQSFYEQNPLIPTFIEGFLESISKPIPIVSKYHPETTVDFIQFLSGEYVHGGMNHQLMNDLFINGSEFNTSLDIENVEISFNTRLTMPVIDDVSINVFEDATYIWEWGDGSPPTITKNANQTVYHTYALREASEDPYHSRLFVIKKDGTMLEWSNITDVRKTYTPYWVELLGGIGVFN